VEELESRLVLSPAHVVIVIESNQGYGSVIGNSSAPYINTLAQSGASFTSSHGISSVGEPNYLALFSASTQGVTDDGSYTFSAANLATRLGDQGLTFGGYSEDLPYTGYTGDQSGAYHRYHAPWVSFSNVAASANMPFSSFPSDYNQLPTVSIVVPNFNNDMHDGTVAAGDAWLQNNIAGYVTWANSHNSLLIVTWDHDSTGSSSNQVATLFVGPMVQSGTYSETINHYNVLRTLENLYGLSTIGTNDGNATPITDVWTPVATHLSVGLPAITYAGQSLTVTVTALDQFNNAATGYQCTVHFSSTDTQASLPADYRFVAADMGTHSFTVTLNTVGQQAITAVDTVTPTINGSAQVPVVRTPDHVVIVIEENHGYGDIIGDTTDAPYINNTLAAQGAVFTQSFAVTHPSQPNYLALFSGSTQGVTDDNGPLTFSTANLASRLTDNSLTFGGYSEDLPYTGYTGLNYGAYARRHNPWVNFTNVASSANMPFSSFPSDYSQLPTVSIVVPNVNNDMHDGTIAAGDAWLQNNIDGYKQWAASHNSLLIVTWDEDDSSGTNQIPTIIVGSQVQPGNYAETINHYNVLRTVEAMYGLSPITSNDANATAISDFWSTSTPPPAPSGLVAVASGSQINLSWTPNSTNQTGFRVERATDIDFTQNLTLLATTPASATSYSDATASAGVTYFYRLRATNSSGDSVNSNTGSATLFPAGWSAGDIGGPGQAGSTIFDGTTWTVNGGGSDIWTNSDQFQYAYTTVSGDATIIAHVTSVQNTNFWGKAGVMVRDGTAADAANVLVAEDPNGLVEFQWRESAGGASDWTGSQMGPTGVAKWLELVRSGDTFSAYYATTNGTPAAADWVLVGSHTVVMSAPTVGLAVSAVDNTGLCAATFSNVSVTGLWRQTTVADFIAGTQDGTLVTNTSGGEVQLASGATNGTFTSSVFDATRAAVWGTASWTANVPAGTTLTVQTQSGNTATPDGTWSDWSNVADGGTVSSPGARYLQYRVIFTTNTPDVTPVLFDINFTWS
jgi:hypothetical protein